MYRVSVARPRGRACVAMLKPSLAVGLLTLCSGQNRKESRNEPSPVCRLVGFASTLGLIEPQTIISVLADGKRQIGYLANRTAGAEGAWELKRIEGKVPKDLNGTLYRVAPGQKEIFGVRLQHLFDGDAFVSRYSFREGKVSLRARFVE